MNKRWRITLTWDLAKRRFPDDFDWSICRELLIAEFYDTETRKTWSVDDCGHTKRDYRVEKTEDFISRWKQKEEPKNDFDVWTFD